MGEKTNKIFFLHINLKVDQQNIIWAQVMWKLAAGNERMDGRLPSYGKSSHGLWPG